MLQVHQGLYNSAGESEHTATLGMKGSFQCVVPFYLHSTRFWKCHAFPFRLLKKATTCAMGLRSPISPGKIHENAVFFVHEPAQKVHKKMPYQGHRLACQAADSRTWSLVALSELPANVAASLC